MFGNCCLKTYRNQLGKLWTPSFASLKWNGSCSTRTMPQNHWWPPRSLCVGLQIHYASLCKSWSFVFFWMGEIFWTFLNYPTHLQYPTINFRNIYQCISDHPRGFLASTTHLTPNSSLATAPGYFRQNSKSKSYRQNNASKNELELNWNKFLTF